jgi:hypothetical protein
MPNIGRFLPRLGPPAPARGPFFLWRGWACRRSSRGRRRLDSLPGRHGVPRASGRPTLGGGVLLLLARRRPEAGAIVIRDRSTRRACVVAFLISRS